MELITRKYMQMLTILRVLGCFKITKIPKVKGAIYSYYSKKVTRMYNNISKIKDSDRTDNTKSIISLTSYGVRINKVHITLDSIFSQSIRPYKVILWLSEDEFNIETIPIELKIRLSQYKNFDIGFCEDLKPHKKYYETMLRYGNHNIITADDDVFYPVDWLETLLELHKDYPYAIVCNNAHKMTILNGAINCYEKWQFLTKETGPSLLLCPVGVGGVLYPPGTLHHDLYNKDLIKSTCLYADDLWLKTMGLLNRTKVVNSNKYSYTFLSIDGSKETALSNNNVIGGGNNLQLHNIMKIYKSKIEDILR